MSIALFPGSFDPFHLGHLAIVEWAAQTYDEVVVAVLGNPEKPAGMFTPEARVELAVTATRHLPNVRCLNFHGVTGDLAKQQHADVIIRSAHKDADLERSLAVFNKFMSGGVPTAFAPSFPDLGHISSTAVRDLLASRDLAAAEAMVPEVMRDALPTAARVEVPDRRPSGGAGPMTVGRRVEPVRVAAVLHPPVFLDRDETLDLALSLVERAGGDGAGLVVFPQAFLPGYPEWIGRSNPGDEEAARLNGAFFDNAVVVGSAVTQVLALAAKRHRTYVSIGVNERDATLATLVSTQLLFSPEGEIVAKQRLLAPTVDERRVWSAGGGTAPSAAETPFGRIGTLAGADVYLPLARAALCAQGVDILLAPTYDAAEVWTSTMRHVGREGHVFVIGVNQRPFAAVVVGPSGEQLAGPGDPGADFVSFDIDANDARHLRQRLDPAGMIGRRELFDPPA